MLDSAVRFDLDRERRIGLPEAVFCAGKPFDTLAGLFARFALRNAPPVLFTRLDAEVFAKIDPDTAGKYNFDPLSRTAWNAVRPSPARRVRRSLCGERRCPRRHGGGSNA